MKIRNKASDAFFIVFNNAKLILNKRWIKVQGIDQEEIRKSYKELYQEELSRIPKLEKLLRDNNIKFNS